MNWENPTFETLKKFETLIELLSTLNRLEDLSNKKCRFSWNFSGTRMYIDGIPDALAILMSLLWCHTEHYAYYMFQEDGNSMIEVIYH